MLGAERLVTFDPGVAWSSEIFSSKPLKTVRQRLLRPYTRFSVLAAFFSF